MSQMVAMRAGQVVMMGNVIGSPSAALATNQAACAMPQRHPWLVPLANSVDDKKYRRGELNAHKICKHVVEAYTRRCGHVCHVHLSTVNAPSWLAPSYQS